MRYFSFLIFCFLPFVLYAQSKPKRDVSKDRSVQQEKKKTVKQRVNTTQQSQPSRKKTVVYNPSTSQKSNALEEAQKYMIEGDYVAAQPLLISVLRSAPNNLTAKMLLTECEEAIKKRNISTYNAYREACNIGTIASLQGFISKYPNSEYVYDVKNRIRDYNLWYNAKEKNTVSSYNAYLEQSPILAYRSDALDAIKSIEGEKEWEICKNSDDEDRLNAFIQSYPNSGHVEQARYRINVLAGERCFSSKNYSAAYSYLNTANSFQALTGVPAEHLKQLVDDREFESILSSTNVGLVKHYYSKLSSLSPYYVRTSNHLALLMGQKLSIYSTDEYIKETLSYAKDEQTKSTVKQFISKVKADKSIYKHQKRYFARKAWWKNRFMFGWNIYHVDYMDELASIGSGFKFRFGRWSDFINLVFGAEYSYITYIDKDQYFGYHENFLEQLTTVAHSVEFPVGLKFNLFKIGKRSKFYIGCNASYGFNLIKGDHFKVNDRTLSIEPQFGISSKHVDFGFYYKRYLKDYFIFQGSDSYNYRYGCFMTCYF